mmetsp:Transcript_5494/g.8177  ORF Transcript_5494/g.8177 Transcript_5494/m.8177 type:complete len:83 (-) Transcript_5494:776-1024(-)
MRSIHFSGSRDSSRVRMIIHPLLGHVMVIFLEDADADADADSTGADDNAEDDDALEKDLEEDDPPALIRLDDLGLRLISKVV